MIKLAHALISSLNSRLLKFTSLCTDLRTNLLSNYTDDSLD